MGVVFWCEINELPFSYEDMLAISGRNTNVKGANLALATAAATIAANTAFEEKLQGLSWLPAVRGETRSSCAATAAAYPQCDIPL